MENIKLNENQMKAVEYNKGAMIVLAGPGSGKTTVITSRVKNLINKGVMPHRILVITFTKSAVKEMESRFKEQYQIEGRVMFSTFHSLFYKIIREFYNCNLNNIINEFDKNNIMKSIATRFKVNYGNEEEFLKNITKEISLVKNELINVEDYNSLNFSGEDFSKMYNAYEEFKEYNNKIDFDDMLTKCYYLLKSNEVILERWKNKFDYILVDEFQDINKVQYLTLKMLAKGNIFVVGDDDQSIYKFRGARPEFLFEFIKDYEDVEKIILDTNYRSTDDIIKLSNKIISDNKNRFPKQIKGVKGKFKPPILIKSKDINEESLIISKRIRNMVREQKVDPSDIAVIFRNNIQGRGIAYGLEDLNIPFLLKDTIPSIYKHFVVIDVLAYLRLALNNNDGESFARIINKPTRYMSKVITNKIRTRPFYTNGVAGIREWEVKKMQEMEFYVKALKKRKPYDAIKYLRKGINYDSYIEEYAKYKNIKPKSLFEVLNEIMEISKKFETIEEFILYCDVQKDKKNDIMEQGVEGVEGVTLTTFHSAKGLEFKIVFIISVIEGLVPYELSKTESEIEEERRLFYVGITRAKETLYLSVIKTRYDKDVENSRFIKNITKKENK